MWRLRTDCFNEERESFIVSVPPKSLAVSRFVFSENYLSQRKLNQGNIKGRERLAESRAHSKAWL